ncbi:MAG: hypothetical protein ACI4UO_04200 [Paludibacteraceae bacterium]
METQGNKYGTSCQSQETKVPAGKGSLKRTFLIITEEVVRGNSNSVTSLPDYLQQGCYAWQPLTEAALGEQGIIVLNIALSDAKEFLNRKAFLPKRFIYGRLEEDGCVVEMYEWQDDSDVYEVRQKKHLYLQESIKSGEPSMADGESALPVSWMAVQEAFGRYEKVICQMKSLSEKYRAGFDRAFEYTLEENKTGHYYYLHRGLIYRSFSAIYHRLFQKEVK